MPKKKISKKTSHSTEIIPNKAAEAPKVLTTLTEYYQHWYKVLFDKLPKEEQEALLANLAKGQQLIRGEAREFTNVRDFSRAVIEKAETEYDKAEAKKKADSEKVKQGK